MLVLVEREMVLFIHVALRRSLREVPLRQRTKYEVRQSMRFDKNQKLFNVVVFATRMLRFHRSKCFVGSVRENDEEERLVNVRRIRSGYLYTRAPP